ncbi:hypothetical protein CKAN_01460300 [Cinnamomum micranthum f. kanehirae]|uniref:Uncharacterized protein n=1 Tax=Cinnamomum micranthum f. kanehirae TaxID=337451 RepID=A0A3S3NSN2_9MAGN|nr:hypothetical protein CKAN_01460300 [Cinnamomum micranthum f. kanehirae]
MTWKGESNNSNELGHGLVDSSCQRWGYPDIYVYADLHSSLGGRSSFSYTAITPISRDLREYRLGMFLFTEEIISTMKNPMETGSSY